MTIATSINSDGEIVGAYCNTAACASSGGTGARGFLRAPNGTFTTFAAPNGGSIFPIIANQAPTPGINLAGTVAGTYVVSPGFRQHGFLRAKNGTLTTFDVPGALGTDVFNINQSGTIIGFFSSPTGPPGPGFLRMPDGKVTVIKIPGGFCDNIPVGINPAGAVTGAYSGPSCTSPGAHGYLRTPGGTIIKFDPKGSQRTSPGSINPLGTIAGNFFDGSTVHGFLRSPSGVIQTFDATASSVNTFVSEINPAGVIIGFYSDAKGVFHGFLRIP